MSAKVLLYAAFVIQLLLPESPAGGEEELAGQILFLRYKRTPGPISYLFIRERQKADRFENGGEVREKIRQTNESFRIIAAEASYEPEGWLLHSGKSAPFQQELSAKYQRWGSRTDGCGRIVLGKTSGYEGSSGRGGVPVPLAVLSSESGFPWLPDTEVHEQDSWEDTVQVAEFGGVAWGQAFPVKIHWKFVGINEIHRIYREDGELRTSRKCAEIEFEFEGSYVLRRRHEKGTFRLEGKGRWLFDIEHGIDVLVEKEVTYGPVIATEKGKVQDATRYITKKVLSENVLVTPEQEEPQKE